jgi:hypothetical protein
MESADENNKQVQPKVRKPRKPLSQEELQRRRDTLKRGRETIARNRMLKQQQKKGTKYKVQYDDDDSNSSGSEDELIIAKRSKKPKRVEKPSSHRGSGSNNEIAELKAMLMEMKNEKHKKPVRQSTIINLPAQQAPIQPQKDSNYSEQYKSRILKY